MKNIILILLAFTTLIACNKNEFELSQNVEDKFFLKINDATMPVIVKGNTTSKTFCIVLHGGPGDSAIQSFSATNSFAKVEEKIAMVYYDQRCSGLSQGNCDATQLDIPMFVNDIDKLVELLEYQYGDEINLFILGHSWGATLALDYLVNGEHRSKIKGCIQSNGSHNIPMVSREEKKILMQYADEQIKLGESKEIWEEINKSVKDLDSDNFWDRIAIVEACYKTMQPLIEANVVNTISFKLDNYVSHLSNSFITSNSIKVNNNQAFYEKILSYDLSSDLYQINTPLGLYWGKHDLVHPPIMANTIFDLLGSQEKEVYFFEKSHHAPMAHENDLYQKKVMEFIEKYRYN